MLLTISIEDPILDLEKLKEDSEKAFEEYGWYGFLNIFGGKFTRTDGYGGLSLVYNKETYYQINKNHERQMRKERRKNNKILNLRIKKKFQLTELSFYIW